MRGITGHSDDAVFVLCKLRHDAANVLSWIFSGFPQQKSWSLGNPAGKRMQHQGQMFLIFAGFCPSENFAYKIVTGIRTQSAHNADGQRGRQMLGKTFNHGECL